MSEPAQETTPTPLTLQSPLTALAGIGPAVARRFSRLGITRAGDLLHHIPLRYEREAAEGGVDTLVADTPGTVRGTVVWCRWVPAMRRGGKGRFEATLEDHAGRTLSLTWFNMRFLADRIHPGSIIRVQGKPTRRQDYFQMVNPRWEDLSEAPQAQPTSEGLHPIYPATESLTSRVIELRIAEALPSLIDQVNDPLPEAVRRACALPELRWAVERLHRPESEEQAAEARRRLAFDELLMMQLGIALKRHDSRTRRRAPALRWSDALDRHIRGRFPFPLTDGQNQVIQALIEDLQQTRPMNRLIQGDVGSGKTVVALYAMLMAVASDHQAVMMAPTQILAEQHFLSISTMLDGSRVRLGLISGGNTVAEKRRRAAMLEQLRDGELDMVVGTQALAQENVVFKSPAVVVIDEQHRFGVLQRGKLRRSGESRDHEDRSRTSFSPHYLVMTATPIPRSLSLTLFGDLDLSTLKGMPPGRTPVTTRVLPLHRREEVYDYLIQRLDQGDRAYVVLPTIEDSDDVDAPPLRTVSAHAAWLKERYGDRPDIELLHGRIKTDERKAVMERFRQGRTRLLVATTIIEVGVDVPEATMMVVEHAERFGLSQLHQLRGRIGRGPSPRRNVCVFLAEPNNPQAEQRMEAIGRHHDGFRLAEKDLEIRGMGDFFGTRQSGMPPLKVAQLPRQLDLLQMAGREARAIVNRDPKLRHIEHRHLRELLIEVYGQTLSLIDIG
ncbi:MAG: ATP-dependent DNA helicase RecG [Phycisphaeraceae bacterium]|nr:ATP-dependent DNA helicase RecG [Phycisphaeraceae bacterium]